MFSWHEILSSTLPRSPQDLETQRTDHGAWAIIREFATTDLTLPAVEKRLHDYLGAGYRDTDWRPALKAVMDAEGNTEQALDAIHKLSNRSAHPRLTIKIPAAIRNTPVEKELAECLHDLKQRKRIHGPVPTIDDLVDPEAERGITTLSVPDQIADEEIVAMVQKRQTKDDQMDVEESDDSSDDGEDDLTETRQDVIQMCARLERLCIKYGNSETSLSLPQQLLRFRGHLRAEAFRTAKQTQLEDFFLPRSE